MNLLGFDRSTKEKSLSGLTTKASNPFDSGLVGNCKDFWSAGRELDVEYDKLYEVINEGFEEAKRRREREDDEESLSSLRKSSSATGRKGLFMGLGIPRVGGSRRAGYGPVSQVYRELFNVRV